LISALVRQVTDPNKEELRTDLSGALGGDVVVDDEIALGDFSIMYSAERRERRVVVKAALPSIK